MIRKKTGKKNQTQESHQVFRSFSNVAAGFEGLIHHLLAVSFSVYKHGEPFPEPFGHAQQRSAEALMSDKEFSLAIVGT